MGLRGILRYSGTALLAALIVGVPALALAARRRGRTDRAAWRSAVAAGYLAAVAQIIGLRFGLRSWRWMGGLAAIKPEPLRTTREVWALGAWPFIYHAIGNAAWFAPLGALLALRRPRRPAWIALAAGAALSLTVECAQLLLGTGIPDVDDVLYNALGALLGWLAARAARKRRDSSSRSQ